MVIITVPNYLIGWLWRWNRLIYVSMPDAEHMLNKCYLIISKASNLWREKKGRKIWEREEREERIWKQQPENSVTTSQVKSHEGLCLFSRLLGKHTLMKHLVHVQMETWISPFWVSRAYLIFLWKQMGLNRPATLWLWELPDVSRILCQSTEIQVSLLLQRSKYGRDRRNLVPAYT